MDVEELITVDGLPDLSGIRRIMASYRGQAAFLMELRSTDGKLLGNNGDLLMYRVFLKVLGDLGIDITPDPRSAKLIILPPNGAMLETYRFPVVFAHSLAGLPDVPLVMFPSSALFPEQDPSSFFIGRKSETLWVLRESFSYAHLRDLWGRALERAGVQLVVDHDIVASGHVFVREFVDGHLSNETLLVGARRDAERSQASLVPGAPAARKARIHKRLAELSGMLPYGELSTRIGRGVSKRENLAAGQTLLGRISNELRERIEREDIVYCDIAARPQATFGKYVAEICRADTIVTNRLHIGLPAAILGKDVVFVEGGYHKIKGVYQQSLTKMHNVTLVGSDAGLE